MTCCSILSAISAILFGVSLALGQASDGRSASIVLAATPKPQKLIDAEELPGYLLVADTSVIRDKTAADAVFFAYDAKSIAAKLNEFGVEFPKNVNFPRGSLFVLVVSDYTRESFASISAIKAKRLFIVDLEKDKDAELPKPVPAGKKNSRVLVVGCPPIRGIGGWAIKTADGKRHDVKSVELKK